MRSLLATAKDETKPSIKDEVKGALSLVISEANTLNKARWDSDRQMLAQMNKAQAETLTSICSTIADSLKDVASKQVTVDNKRPMQWEFKENKSNSEGVSNGKPQHHRRQVDVYLHGWDYLTVRSGHLHSIGQHLRFICHLGSVGRRELDNCLRVRLFGCHPKCFRNTHENFGFGRRFNYLFSKVLPKHGKYPRCKNWQRRYLLHS